MKLPRAGMIGGVTTLASNTGLFRGATADKVRGRNPTPAELRQMAIESKAPEDYERWQGPEGDKMLQNWITRQWDPNAGGFKTWKTDARTGQRLQGGVVYKPDDTPEGWSAYGGSGGALPTAQVNAMTPQQGITLGQLGGLKQDEAAQMGGDTGTAPTGVDPFAWNEWQQSQKW